jgi:hypothetical protein
MNAQVISSSTGVKPLERLRAKAAPIWERIRAKAGALFGGSVALLVQDPDYLADLAEAAALGGCPRDVANLIANALQHLADDLRDADRLRKAIRPAEKGGSRWFP